MQCQAQVEDWANAEHWNVGGRRGRLAVTDYKPCSRSAKARVGKLCFCTQHVKLALDGLVDESGRVADRASLRDVRSYPKKFPGGLYRWARDLKSEPLP